MCELPPTVKYLNKVGYIPDALDILKALIHPDHETEVKTNIAAFQIIYIKVKLDGTNTKR